MYCKHCGSEMPDDAIFCSHCGTRLIADEPQQPEEPAFEQAEPVAAEPVAPAEPKTPAVPKAPEPAAK